MEGMSRDRTLHLLTETRNNEEERNMRNARKILMLGLCALLLVSFSPVFAHKSFAEGTTVTGTVRSGRLWVDRQPYTLAGPYGEDVAKLKGEKVEVTGRIDYENMTIEVLAFKDLGPAL